MRKVLLVLGMIFKVTTLLAFIPARFVEVGTTVGAEWIYFSPTSETLSYAILATGANATIFPSDQRIIENRFDDFYSGYRVFAASSLCQGAIFFAARYSSLEAKHSSSITIPTPTEPPFTVTLAPLLVGPSFSGLVFNIAQDSRRFTYRAVDAILGLPLIQCPCLFFYAFGGLHYADLASKDDYFYRIPFVPAIGADQALFGELKNTFWGIGPLFGARMEKYLGCGFSLQGSIAGALLIGHPRDANKNTLVNFVGLPPSETADIETDRPWRAVPYGDINVGILYEIPELCFCPSFHFIVEVGYEALVYFRALAEIRDLGLFDNTSFRNVTLHGLYLSFAVNF